MADLRGHATAHPFFGWLCIVMGLIPVLIALGVIKPDPSNVHAPMWVVAVGGTIFILAGFMILLGQRSRFTNLLASLLCACFGCVGAWISLFAPPQDFSGGIPFMPDAFNLILARWIFGLGAAMSFAISIFAFRQFYNPSPGR